jgi:predicted small secreted protein
MKKMFKMSGIIFLLAVICFVMATCEEDESIGSKVNVSGSSLARKIEWVQSHRSSGTTYTIDVTADEEISGYMFTSGSNKNMTIILNGNGKTISLKNDAISWLFFVGDNITLELKNITLKGHDNNRASLVVVIGTLVMNDGTKIIGNKMMVKHSEVIGFNVVNKDHEVGNGGGVWVYPLGIFTMNGGEISGNSAGSGGGVYVGQYGIFTMNSGKISGNTYGSKITTGDGSGPNSGSSYHGYGGGVSNYGTFIMNGGEISNNTYNYYNSLGFCLGGSGGGVLNSGTFRITNGTIYGSNAADDLKNTAGAGAALSGVSAQYGTFSGDTWISDGNLSATNDTIRVINRELK